MRPSAICETEAGSGHLRPDPGFGWTVLQRHGRRPLAILGRVLLRANNRCAGLPFWSEITIYETTGYESAGYENGSLRFAVSLRHAQRDLAEPGWCDAWLCDTPDAIRAVFQGHDPLWALPPAGSHDPLGDEAASARQFRGAWAGLLAAVFGLHPAPGSAA